MPRSPVEGIHRAEERDHRDQHDVLRIRKQDAARDHEGGAEQQQIADIVAGAEVPDQQRRRRCAEQRRRRHDADLQRVEADLGKIRGQDDDRETVAESARRARDVEQHDATPALIQVRRSGCPSMRNLQRGLRSAWTANRLAGSLPSPVGKLGGRPPSSFKYLCYRPAPNREGLTCTSKLSPQPRHSSPCGSHRQPRRRSRCAPLRHSRKARSSPRTSSASSRRVNNDGKDVVKINYIGGPRAMPPFEVGNAVTHQGGRHRERDRRVLHQPDAGGGRLRASSPSR